MFPAASQSCETFWPRLPEVFDFEINRSDFLPFDATVDYSSMSFLETAISNRFHALQQSSFCICSVCVCQGFTDIRRRPLTPEAERRLRLVCCQIVQVVLSSGRGLDLSQDLRCPPTLLDAVSTLDADTSEVNEQAGLGCVHLEPAFTGVTLGSSSTLIFLTAFFL